MKIRENMHKNVYVQSHMWLIVYWVHMCGEECHYLLFRVVRESDDIYGIYLLILCYEKL